MRQIDEGIFYEDSFPGVTLGALVFSEGIIVIDSPLRSDDARSWRSMLMNHRGWTNRLLVNLDSHPDRTLGAKAMETTIVTHHMTAEIFKNRSTIFKGQGMMDTGSEWESYNEAIGMRWATPEITFNERMVLHWNNSEIKLEHHPGATSEAIWVILPEEKVIFVGDTVVKNQPPFLADSDLNLWEAELDLLLKFYRDYVIISGRGGPATNEDIHEFRKFIRNVARRLERRAKKCLLPEVTEKMVPTLLSKFRFPRIEHDVYEKRLRYGLYQCYLRNYSPLSADDQSGFEGKNY